MKIEVVYSPAARVVETSLLELPEGSTVLAALAASGLRVRHEALEREPMRVGVWGRVCRLDRPLAEGDRVEVYRALQVDPKEARRQRGRRQAKLRKTR